jgi:tetratricopeptide (TPR) repeat protein
MHPHRTASRLPPLLPCLLLALAVAGPARGQATGTDAQVARCQALVRSSPHDALALAERLLAAPALPPAVEIGAINCRSIALNLLGRDQDSRRMAARLHVLLQTPGLPLDEYDQVQRRTAWLLLRDGLTEEGLQILEAVQERSIAKGDVSGQVLALGHIALIHAEQLDDPEGALHYQRQAFALSGHLQRLPLPQDLTLNYNHGHVLLQLKRHDEADKAFNRAEGIARRLSGQDVLLHRIRSDRAEILRARGQPEAARAELLAVLRWQQRNSPMGQAATLHYLARIALEQGALQEARDLAEQMLAMAEAGKFPANTRDSLDLLAKVSLAQGDMAQARDYLQRVRQLDRARRMGSASLARLARLQARAEQALDPARINALQEASRDRLLRDIALAAVAALLLGGAGLYLRVHRLRQRLRRFDTVDGVGARH